MVHLSGQVALVTGASRGIGRGIALQLGKAGATVYVTGRPPAKSDANKLGDLDLPSLEKTANEITMRGGKGIAVYCDHSNMDEVKALFERIESETSGHLDILVNNAYSAVASIFNNVGKKFYEQPVELWDEVNNVGLRNHYYCSWYATKLMLKHKKGLIVNVSSIGGLKYLFNIPYGVGKQALDRMSADMAIELRSQEITVVSIWPGAVKTELVNNLGKNEGTSPAIKKLFEEGETIEYSGLAIAHLAADLERINLSGKILMTRDLADKYGFKDVDGSQPHNPRAVWQLLQLYGYVNASKWVPDWVKLPGWVLWTAGNKL